MKPLQLLDWPTDQADIVVCNSWQIRWSIYSESLSDNYLQAKIRTKIRKNAVFAQRFSVE